MTNKIIEKINAVLPHVFFIYYFCLCLHYFQLRLFYSDNAYLLFRLIQDESFAIFHHRWVGIFTQWLPLIGIKLQLPFKVICFAYSFNLALIYYLVFLVLYYVLKQKTYALSIVLLLGLLQHFAFFWQVSEINTGLPIFFLLIALMVKNANKNPSIKSAIITNIISISILFIHPILSIALVVCSALLFLYYKHKNYAIAFFISLLILLIKYKFLSGFEASKIHSFDKTLFTWKAIQSSYLYYSFKEMSFHQFKFIWLMYVGFFVVLVYQKRFLLACCSLISIFCFFLLMYYYMPNGATVDYMETYFIVCFVPILILILLQVSKWNVVYQNIFMLVVFCISMYGLMTIKKAKIYKDRLAYLETLLNKTDNLSYIEKGDLKDDVVMLAWALPYETLLKSTLDGKSKSVFYNEAQLKIDEITDTSIMLGADWERYIPQKQLNNTYFELKPTKYQRINGILH